MRYCVHHSELSQKNRFLQRTECGFQCTNLQSDSDSNLVSRKVKASKSKHYTVTTGYLWTHVIRLFLIIIIYNSISGTLKLISGTVGLTVLKNNIFRQKDTHFLVYVNKPGIRGKLKISYIHI